MKLLTSSLAAFVAALAALLTLAHHLEVGYFSCETETEPCAITHEKNGYYTGVLTDRGGQPVPNASFKVSFPSRKDLAGVAIRTDAHGRYCVIWAEEQQPPTGTGSGGDTVLRVWKQLGTGPTPAKCQRSSAGVPWNRAAGLRTRWQYQSVLWGALGALVLLALSLLRVGIIGFRLRLAGVVLAGVTLVLAVAVWTIRG